MTNWTYIVERIIKKKGILNQEEEKLLRKAASGIMLMFLISMLTLTVFVPKIPRRIALSSMGSAYGD